MHNIITGRPESVNFVMINSVPFGESVGIVHVWCLAGSDWFQQISEECAIITIFETALLQNLQWFKMLWETD